MASVRTSSAPVTVETPTVLVVDDEAGIRNALQRAIAKGGYTSILATDGAEGLAQAAKNDPSVIILDLRMPNMDGHTFLRRLATLDLDCAVIVSSADGQMDDVIEVMRQGAVDYVKKPWSMSEVISSLSRAVEIRDKRRSLRALGATPAGAATAPASEAPEVATFPQILERIQRGEILLPSVPSTVEELRSLVADRDVPIERLAKLVERDQALVARVLQLGRSVHHGAGKQGLDLRATIARLGLQTLHALVETVWLNSCFQSRDQRFVPFTRRLARFGLARAISARQLAAPAKLVGSLGYFGGLFADVGAAFLLHVVVEKSAGTPPSPEACLAFIRDHHEPIGALLLTQWGHDEQIIRLSRHHHHTALPLARDQYARLSMLATAAACQITGEDDLTGEAAPRGQVEQCARDLGIDAATVSRSVGLAEIELAAILEVL